MGGGGSEKHWKFHLKINTGDESMKNRVAYVNRHGMLITDSKSFSKNPFGVNINMGKYVAVVWAADDTTDAMVREMEPPTHESIEYKRIEDQVRRDRIAKQLQDISDKISHHIRRKLDLETFDQKTELNELSDIIPYVSDPEDDNIHGDDNKAGSHQNQTIETRTIRTGIGTVRAEEDETTGGESDDDDGDNINSGGGADSKPPDGSTLNTRKTTSNMDNIRVVRHGGGSLRVAFDTKTGANKFVIKPVGEESKDEPPITVTAAGGVSGASSVKVLDENTIRVNAEPGSRVILDVSPDKLPEYASYTILEYRARRTAK